MGRIDPGFWLDRRVLLTGHTGFKGAWLTLWLTELGARVTGLSLPPCTRPSLFALAGSGRAANIFGDISAYAVVLRTVADCDPEIIIHTAAQVLVPPSSEWLHDNPAVAAVEFVARHPNFVIEDPRWRFNESQLDRNITGWPNAWLKRVH